MAEGAPPARGGSNSVPPKLPTRPRSPAAPRKGPAEAKLTCRAGPRAGEEFPLELEAYVIGRAADADLSIPDTSVSRRHARLARGELNWTITDLNSGNGVLLNGERIDQETPVRHGDVIVLGDTELAFADLANATDRAPIPTRPPGAMPRRTADRPSVRTRGTRLRPASEDPKLKMRRRFAQVSIVLLALATLLMAVRYKKKMDHKNELEARQEQEREKVAKRKLDLFREAAQLGRDGNWREARTRFLQLKAMDPAYPEIQDALENAAAELPNQDAITEARAQLEGSHLAEANRALAKVSPNTMMFDQVAKVKSDLAAKAAAKVELARKSLEAHKRADAATLSADVLAAFPDDRDALSIHESATSAPGHVARAASTRAHSSRVGSDPDVAVRVDEPAGNPKQSGPLFRKALAAKASGDPGHAALYARQALKADPSNAPARAMVDELRLEAKEVYRAAYGEQETDAADALQKLHQVLNMTAPGDEYNAKAAKLIEKLKQ